jgi:dimethylhistidine N-methyltransferase
LGSGSATKTRNIIEALLLKQNNLLFVPIDISLSALETSADALLQTYGDLSVEAYAADYYAGLNEISQTPRTSERILALFLGSNIGNFEIEEAIKFLRVLRKCLKAGDALLLGADLKKDKKVLEDAYDDPLGLTAVFNLNQLARINRELDANFNLRAFRHRTFYNEDKGRIEIYIESLREQTVVIRKLDLQIKFNKGEMMHTENSCKYDLDLLSWLAKETGFERKKTWMDEEERFSSNLFFAV